MICGISSLLQVIHLQHWLAFSTWLNGKKYKRLNFDRLGFKIVAEAQVEGDYYKYRDTMKRRNLIIGVITIAILVSAVLVSMLMVIFKDS